MRAVSHLMVSFDDCTVGHHVVSFHDCSASRHVVSLSNYLDGSVL